MPKPPKVFSPSGYYKIRLEHTLKHTVQTTKLIYLINGATLGLLYFVAKMDGLQEKKLVIAWVLAGLAFINVMHALLIRRQGQWYGLLSRDFALKSGVKVKEQELNRPSGFPWLGTHALHATIHYGIAAFLAYAAYYVLTHSIFLAS